MVTTYPLPRARIAVFATAIASLSLEGCQLVARIQDRTLEIEDADLGWDQRAPDPPDGGPDAPGEGGNGPDCTTNAECTARATAGDDLDAALFASPYFQPDAFTGTIDGGIVPAVCIKPAGRCVRLLTGDCRAMTGDFLNDNSIIVGTYLTTSGSLAASNIPRERSAVLAAEEINTAIAGGGIPPAEEGGPARPLLVLQCDPSADPLRTARHLADDLHVPAVVGPNVAEDVITVTQQVSARAGMLLMSPTAPPDPVSNLVDNGLTWRAVPSDSQRAKLLIDQINEVETSLKAARGNRPLRLAIPFRNDALGLSARDSISGKLLFNGHFISDPQNAQYVSLDPYGLTDTASQAAIATKYATFLPDIIFMVANETVSSIAIPLEQHLALTDAGVDRPYYVVTDVVKVPTWLTAAAMPTIPADFRSRVRGMGVRPDGNSTSVFASFNAAYTSRYGANPGTSAMGPSYDSMYAIAYALAATRSQPVTGASVAQGLRSLSSGDSLQVGQNQANNAFQQLAAGKSIALRGTYSLLQWDFNGDIVGGTMEVWCIGLSGGMPVFASAGKTMDVATQIVNGSYTQCN